MVHSPLSLLTAAGSLAGNCEIGNWHLDKLESATDASFPEGTDEPGHRIWTYPRNWKDDQDKDKCNDNDNDNDGHKEDIKFLSKLWLF